MAANKVLVALLLVVLLAGATAYPLCNIDTKDLAMCRAAVTPPQTGKPLPPPTNDCCAVLRRANLKCLCNLKSLLPDIGIDPANALALPPKCGLQAPPECHA